MRSMIDGGEQLMRERLASIPDGRWSHRAFTEAALPGDRGIYAYQVNITKHEGRMIVDNLGTDPQAGSINVTYAAFAGAVQAATVSQLVGELAGAYGGAHRVIEIRPEPGLLSCADHPGGGQPVGRLHDRDAAQRHGDRGRQDALLRRRPGDRRARRSGPTCPTSTARSAAGSTPPATRSC